MLCYCAWGGVLVKTGGVSAYGKDLHGAAIDTQMEKLHAMMPMFSLASTELESALEKGDAVTAKAQDDKILAATPDLKKSKPHKNY